MNKDSIKSVDEKQNLCYKFEALINLNSKKILKIFPVSSTFFPSPIICIVEQLHGIYRILLSAHEKEYEKFQTFWALNVLLSFILEKRFKLLWITK